MTKVLDRPQPPITTEATSEVSEWDLRRKFGSLKPADRCVNLLTSTKMREQASSLCGAQAFVRAVFPGSGVSLEFCGHCVGENTAKATRLTAAQQRARNLRDALVAKGAVLLSDYDQINLNPTSTEDQKSQKD